MGAAGANIAAGFESLKKGVGQITGLGEQETDEQILARRARDAELAKESSPVGGLLQGLGEQGPIAALPFGTLTGTVLKLGGRAAGTVLPRVGEFLANRGNATGIGSVKNLTGGAAAGAAGGAVPSVTEQEDRAGRAITGGAIGAAGTAGTAALARTLKFGGGAIEAVLDTPGLARKRATRQVGDALAENRKMDRWERSDMLRAEADKARQAATATALPRSVSTAGATGSPALAGLEAQSRSRSSRWVEKDRGLEAESRTMLSDVLQPTASERPARLATRSAARNKAIQDIDTNTPPADAQQAIVGTLQDINNFALTGPGALPPVRDMLRRARTMIGTPNAGVSHLHNLRTYLSTEGPKQGIGEEPLRILMDGLDKRLNAATQGKWGGFLDEWGQNTRPIDESDAAEAVLRKFVGPGGEKTGEISADAVERAMGRSYNDYGPLMTPAVSDNLRYLVEGLRQAESPRGVQFRPTAGADPDQSITRGWRNPLNRAGMAQIVDLLRGNQRASTKRVLDDMLLDPKKFADVIDSQGKPMPKWVVDYLQQQAGQQTGAAAGGSERR